jgi:hypothetical protein
MKAARWFVAATCLPVLVSLVGCYSPREAGVGIQVSKTPAASLAAGLSPLAEGVVFVQGNRAWRVQDRALVEVGAADRGVVAVGYSDSRKHILVVSERAGGRVVSAIPASGSAGPLEILAHEDGSTLGAVRVISDPKYVYYSEFGEPANRLMVGGTLNPHGPARIKLKGTFSGEFDVGAAPLDGSPSIVFTGTQQSPATLTLLRGSREVSLAPGFATMFTPAFSPGADRVCFTGSKRAGESVALWTVGTDGSKPVLVKGAEELTPTYPVFSPDGRLIAFRNADDGLLWSIAAGGGEARPLGIVADDAPFGW